MYITLLMYINMYNAHNIYITNLLSLSFDLFSFFIMFYSFIAVL